VFGEKMNGVGCGVSAILTNFKGGH